jgi:hypothetical protein
MTIPTLAGKRPNLNGFGKKRSWVSFTSSRVKGPK